MDNWLEQFAQTAFRRSGDTAHDLKTPLNVAVLNLELLRMRLAKLGEAAGDEKIAAYASAIEGELRRLGRIFDAFFLLSTPPRDEGSPGEVDLGALANEFDKTLVAPHAIVRAHESRMRQALRLFFDGASKAFGNPGPATAKIHDDRFEISIAGKPADDSFDAAKIFKLYYTDASGNPDLSLASARLIAETYGGELNALEDRGKVVLRLSFPLGDK